MGSFGDRLRREREQRGITLDEVALTTKIRTGLLKALEEEKFDQLPGGIFNKGFVRAYARHLGIDEEQAVADYLAASGELPSPRRPGEPPVRGEVAEPRIQLVHEEHEERSASSKSWSLWAGFLVLFVVGIAAWFYYHRETRTENLSQNPPASASAPQTTSAASTGPPAASAGTGIELSGNRAAASPEGFTVDLKADDDCWMQITADGKSEEITLRANEQKVINATNKVVIRAGSVGALDIVFNGRRLPVQGEYGEVRTLTFTPEGLQPTPTPEAPTPPAGNLQ
jgi:cytoskeleton protein RodZ